VAYFSNQIYNLEKNTDFIFTEKLADELVQKEVALFEEQHSAEYKNINGEERTIELKNIKTSLNGYDTVKPLNQKTKSLQMTIFVSASPEEILKKIEDTISKFFNVGNLKYVSSSLSSFIVVRDLFIEQKNFLLIDIGGELTDISMTKKEILRESISFPLGTNFLASGISRDLKCSFGEANSFLSLYRAGHASSDVIAKIEPAIAKLKTEWLSKFQESLANLSNDISIPANIFITVEKDWANFFSELIKSEQFNQYTLAESKFQITVLGAETLHGIASFDDNVARDPFLIIGSVYVNRHLN
jgi:hypothetical protein